MPPDPLSRQLAASGALSHFDPAFSAYLDKTDPTKTRQHFHIPTKRATGCTSVAKGDDPCVYLCGNSLGLLPKRTAKMVSEELAVWAEKGVLGHFDHPLDRPWKNIDSLVIPGLATVVGAKRSEVACMGSLTSNIHTLLSSFYRPTKERYKILYEEKAFPSDIYAFTSHIEMHSLDPDATLIPLAPRQGEFALWTEDILSAIQEQGDEIAIVMFSGVQFYTGQCFEMQKITAAGHAKGCLVGFDLAHAAGNVVLNLHDWDVDFAAWCTYKYLNAGPGSIAGIFVHERHASRPRLSGWWGHNTATRFSMPSAFDPSPGAAGFQHSNPSVLSIMPLYASLQVFQETFSGEGGGQGMARLRNKSEKLTAYLEKLLLASEYAVPIDQAREWKGEASFTILTPSNQAERGAQLSVLFLPMAQGVMQGVFQHLSENGVVGDEREPDVIRLAPAPLYNTFGDVREAVEVLMQGIVLERERLK